MKTSEKRALNIRLILVKAASDEGGEYTVICASLVLVYWVESNPRLPGKLGN